MNDFSLDDYIDHLNNPNPDVRRNAAWSLGRLRDLRITEPLIAALKDPDPTVRTRAAEALGNMHAEASIQPLITALQYDTDADVRARAARSLGRQGDRAAAEALVAAMADSDEAVQTAVAEALGHLHDPSVVQPLLNTLLHTPSLRHQASRSLMNLGGTAVVEALIATMDAPPDVTVRLYIAEILGHLGDRRAVPALQKLADDVDPGVAETAEWALRQLA